MSPHQLVDDVADTQSRVPYRFRKVDFDSEDVENYKLGGFHPVHLGDQFDNDRYRIVQKLGAGGFSTVWLALDELEFRWVALKMIVAEHSSSVDSKRLLSRAAAQQYPDGASFVVEERHFIFDGPNGRHLCLVLPVLGPSTSKLSASVGSRLTPSLSRRVGYQATRALVELHSQGLCHGDLTAGNITFTLSDIDKYTEKDIERIFGTAEKQILQTETGELPGPEAPIYIVKAIDFLSPKENLISPDVKLIDFDQCFPTTSPPKDFLGTPPQFLAPEVVLGRSASPASDVWALGVSIFKIRSGTYPFSAWEFSSPWDIMQVIPRTLGDTPSSWGKILFDDDGYCTDDPAKGEPIEKLCKDRPLKDMIDKIWDQPENGIVVTGKIRREPLGSRKLVWEPYPLHFSNMFWMPRATKIDNVHLRGWSRELPGLLDDMPKIQEEEAALLLDLLSKIFVYEPQERITAEDMLIHPWFHMDSTDRTRARTPLLREAA